MADPIPCWFNAIFTIVRTAGSAFYGLRAIEIFAVTERTNASWLLHQRWFNFLGAAVGWVALWFLVRDAWASETSVDFNGQHVLLGMLAFAGVTGHLPLGFSGMLQGITELAKRAMDFVGSSKSP